jgi:prepilin-type N-terminal cleavage/methylation domain-containing protein
MLHNLKQEKGFTLVEVLIAVLILLMIVITFTTLFTSSYKGITSSGSRSETLFGLQENIESDIKDPGADYIGNLNIVFTEGSGVSIPGEHRSFRQVTGDQKEVVIDVFVHTNP